MDLTNSELVEIGLDALAAEPPDLPPGMGDRILGAALAERPSAPPVGWDTDGSDLNAHAAFVTTAAELFQLLDTLTPAAWTRRTTVGGGASVRDLVQHLVGVERYLLGQLGRRDPINAPRPEDHFPVLRLAAADLDDVDDTEVARTWWRELLELVRACAELGPDHEVAYHHLASGIRGMLVVRTFELWTHDDDIRRAVGLPANDLDDARLSLMSTTLLDALSVGIALTGTDLPGRAVRIELTGPGGGTSFDIALSLGETPGVPDLTIVTSALDLCRVASNRLAVDRIDVVTDGDRSLLEPVLVGATAFAMD